ncbi:MAG: c-type cytochrome [Bacteroidota bacterium]|nr:c-type cytochrome [Bacteroidota bacterium]
MDFLKQIALPQSEAQIGVLHFVLNVIYLILLPFISYLFGALVLSLYTNRRGRISGGQYDLRFSEEVITHILPTKNIVVLFGVVPFMALVFAYAQLLQSSAAISVSILTWGAILFAAAAAFASSYQSSTKLSGVLNSISKPNDEIETYRSAMIETRQTSGKYALIFLSFAVYFLIAGTSLASQPDQWLTVSSIVQLFLSLEVWVKVVQFLLLSLTIASLGTVYFTYSWQGGKKNIDNGYSNHVKKTALPIGLLSLLAQPVFVVLSIVLLPVSALSGLVFLSAFFIIFFVFITSHFVYGMIKEFKNGYAGNAFYSFFLVLLFIVVQTTSSLSSSTQKHSALVAYHYDKVHEELLAMMGIGVVSMTGEEIFGAKCSACHEFGAKKVGPAYKEVLPKYENDRAKLLSFVLNPQKMDPAFPPMPNQGLKPAEADSISAYIMLMYKQAQK